MSNSKRIVTFGLTVLLVLALSATAWSAEGKVFEDVQPGHWAEKAIAKMKAKGVIAGIAEGKFGPNQDVTRQQAVVFLARVKGLEVTGDAELPADFDASGVADWAKNYVAAAIEDKIIDSTDKLDFRPNEAAKRYEIAVFVARTLGLTAEAMNLRDSSLRYADADEIPDWARGYVAVLDEEGIMSGSGGNFNPQNPVTRAEMAVLLERIDNREKALQDDVIQGQIFSLSASSSTLLLTDRNGEVISLNVVADVPAYKDGEMIDWLNDLDYQETVEVIKNSSGEVAYIEIIDESEFQPQEIEVEGKITDIDTSEKTFSINKGNEEINYRVDTETELTIDGLPGDFSDLEIGQQVRATVVATRAVEVTASSEVSALNGKIVSLDTEKDRIVIEVDSGTERTFVLSEDTQINFNGDEAELEDLLPGQPVFLIAEGRVLELLDVDSLEWSSEGVVKKVSFAPELTIVIADEDGEEMSFEVADDALIRRDGRRRTLRDLVVGDKVELELKDNLVERIYAETVEHSTEGVLQSINRSLTGDSITFVDDEEEIQTYKVSSDVTIYRGDEKAEFSQLMIGDYVEVELEGEVIISMDVQPKLNQDYLVGQVDSLIEKAGVLVLNDVLIQGQKHQVYIDDETIIYWGKRIRDFDYMEEGDQLIVTGQWEADEIFMADVIVIVYH